MKVITAFGKPHELDDVVRALQHVRALTGLGLTRVHGFGRRGAESGEEPREEHVKIEILCRDERGS